MLRPFTRKDVKKRNYARTPFMNGKKEAKQHPPRQSENDTPSAYLSDALEAAQTSGFAGGRVLRAIASPQNADFTSRKRE